MLPGRARWAGDLACRERDERGRAVVGVVGRVDMIRQWRIVLCVEFIETPTFTRLIGKLMDDDEYAKLHARARVASGLGQGHSWQWRLAVVSFGR